MSKKRRSTFKRPEAAEAAAGGGTALALAAPEAADVIQAMGDELQRRAIKLADQARSIIVRSDLPPNIRSRKESEVGRLVNSIVEMQRSWLMSISKVLKNADKAFRENRAYQRQMRYDPDVRGPLMRLQYAVALLDYNIVAEDQDDEEQAEQADELKTIIDRYLPQPLDFHRNLMEAPYYGPALVNVIYQRVGTTKGSRVVPASWLPAHPDTLVFNEEGAVGIKVGPRYEGQKVAGPEGWVHMLDEVERRACVVHRFGVQGADYEEAMEAQRPFAGEGLRSIIWYFWMFKQQAMQRWMDFIDRYANGLRVGYYPQGHRNARTLIETALRNWASDCSVAIPRVADGSKNQADYGMEVFEAGTSAAVAFLQIIEYLSGKIKLMIEGQTATTESTSTGLGSGVSDQHAITFNSIVRFNAKSLAGTLTSDFLWQLHVLNFGPTPHRPKWEYVLERVDPEKYLDAMERFIDAGGSVPEGHAREIIGIPEPEEDEPVLEGRQPEPGAVGGGTEAGAMRKTAEAFKRAMRSR